MRPYLNFEHPQRYLEEDHWALIKEQIPDPKEQTDVHHTGKRCQEPV